MAAYAALLSLAQTTHPNTTQNESLFSSDAAEKVRSIHNYVSSLLWFFEEFPKKVERWEDRIRDVAYEIDNIIDNFMWLQIQSRHKLLNPSRLNLEYQLENAMQRLGLLAGEVNEERPAYLPASSSSSTPETLGDDAVIDLHEDVIMEIKEKLYGDSRKLQVIPIAGMGGIGKTTLVRTLYDVQLNDGHFDVRAWAVASQDYSPLSFKKSLFDSMIVPGKQMLRDQIDESEIADKVYKTLFDRRYLVVIDDIWETKHWDDVRCIFPDNNNGSRIVLTTRQLDVAFYTSPASHVHEMQCMDESQSWELLRQKVFTNGYCPPELQEVGKCIAARCGGLPLAVVLVAGVLFAAGQSQASWKEIAENVIPIVGDNVEAILSLSYTNLPHHLRSCFLFIGGFQKDVNVLTSRLIRLWTAEGFERMEKRCRKSLEEKAHEYLEELVKRNLVVATSRKIDGKIKSCTLHDMVRDLCVKKAHREKFLYVKNGCDLPDQGFTDARRISFDRLNVGTIWAPALRTILSFQIQDVPSWLALLRNYNLLREVDALGVDLKELPSQVFELYHLRYLAVMGSFIIPSAVYNLVHLQTLIIHLSTGKVRRGRYASVRTYSLPMEIWNLPKLRHLLFHAPHVLPHPLEGSNLPLQYLQTLSLIKDLSWNEMIIQLIPNVKRLGLTYTSNEEHGLHLLKHLHQLEKLEVIGCPGFSWRGKNPCFPPTLKKLTLVGGGFPWSDVAIVGSLPNLQVLKLLDNACDGDKWEAIDGSFPSLTFLLIDESNLMEWTAESGSFPRLRRLVLRSCPFLKEITQDIGDIPTLEMVEVDNCTQSLLESAKKIKEDQEDYGNYALQVRLGRKNTEYVGPKNSVPNIFLGPPEPKVQLHPWQKQTDSVSSEPSFLRKSRMVRMLTTLLEPILSKLWDKIVELIADGAHNNLKTIKDFESIFQTLRKNLKALSAKAYDVEKELENAENSGRKKRKQEVAEWLREVGSIEDQVVELGNQVESEGFIVRLMDGGTLAELNEKVDKLVEQSRNFREVTLLTHGMVGKACHENMERILELLGTRQVSSIGVYGMGGVGKTTLATHVHNRLQQQSEGCVCWVTVSQQFTIRSLQDKIARFLDVYLLEEEDIRAAQIHRALSQRNNLVLILDDVWENIDMRKLGCAFSVEGYRLILTSRSSEVCHQNRCQRVIPVDKLPMDEAWELFNVTLRCGTELRLSLPAEVIAKDVAKLCGGLPLGIITVAASLRGETSIHTWKNVFAELMDCVLGKDGMGEVDKVFEILKYSFDGLKKNHQSQSNNEFNTLQLCFLYCSLYPEDWQISREDLVCNFMSEGLMDQRKKRRAQVDQGHSVLDKLVNMCLLESCINYRDKKCVKMHDLVRGMALKIVDGKYMTRAGYSMEEIGDEQDWTEGLEKVSFMFSRIKRIGDGISPDCPKLSTLILSCYGFYRCSELKAIPNSFFSRMPSLCTLDLRDIGIKTLPDSICEMKSLKALLLGGCRKLEIVPYLGKLKALRELNLSFTAIKKVPEGVEELIDLRVLSVYAKGLEMLPRGLLLKLGRLQHVIFPLHIKVPVEELEGLKFLEEFSGGLENVNYFNCLITRLGHDSTYSIFGGSESDEKESYFGPDRTNRLFLSECNLKDVKLFGQGIVHLDVKRCEGMSPCFVDLFSPLNYPTSLKSLEISHCGGTKCILRGEQGSSSQISKTLEVISLKELEDLKEVIQKGEIGASAPPTQPVFSSLKSLQIVCCNKMRKVGLAVLEAPYLKYITISNCGEIEEIFEDEGKGCVSLSRLQYLDLRKLPRLRKLGLSALSPNLESIEIGECGEIEAIFEDEGRGCVALPRLKQLDLWELPRLRKLGLSALSPNLESIDIRWCGEIEEIFEDEGRSSITLPTLNNLWLSDLPKLKSVCQSTMICNSIREITIRNCPRLTKKLPVDDLQQRMVGIIGVGESQPPS